MFQNKEKSFSAPPLSDTSDRIFGKTFCQYSHELEDDSGKENYDSNAEDSSTSWSRTFAVRNASALQNTSATLELGLARWFGLGNQTNEHIPTASVLKASNQSALQNACSNINSRLENLFGIYEQATESKGITISPPVRQKKYVGSFAPARESTTLDKSDLEYDSIWTDSFPTAEQQNIALELADRDFDQCWSATFTTSEEQEHALRNADEEFDRLFAGVIRIQPKYGGCNNSYISFV